MSDIARIIEAAQRISKQNYKHADAVGPDAKGHGGYLAVASGFHAFAAELQKLEDIQNDKC